MQRTPALANAPGTSDGASASAYVALGLLSAAGAAEKSTAGQYRARRQKLREDAARFTCFSKSKTCALRFVLAGGETKSNVAALAEAASEARQHGDMLLINTTEGRFTCSRKYLLWMQAALVLFPAAEYIGLGDDDIYIQLDHFVSDLRSIRRDAKATKHVFWGLMMWKAYYNNVTMVTSTGFTGWGFTDWAAVAQRTQMEACRDPKVNVTIACPGLREDHVEAAQKGQIGSPPFPMANGPLSALSRTLAAAVVHDAYPPAWLAALQKTPRIAAALARPGGPRKSSFACWPVVDSILGHWVAHAAEQLAEPVTLVNTPLMKQHHPWPSAVRGRFSNSSIILHGLKKPQHERFRDLAIARGSGPFEPYVRECDTCRAMGWSTWPSPLNEWRCCGSRVEPRTLRRACRGRMCPKSPLKPLSRSPPGKPEGLRSAVTLTESRSNGKAKTGRAAARSKGFWEGSPGLTGASGDTAKRVDMKIAQLEADLEQLRSRKRSLEKAVREPTAQGLNPLMVS